MQKYTNFKMEKMLKDLEPILKYRGKVGYVAARNTRVLRDTLIEYFRFRDDLVRKYGVVELDGEGQETGRISIVPTSPNFADFTEELNKIGEIEHEIDLMMLKYNDVIDVLSGEEMLNLEWMLED